MKSIHFKIIIILLCCCLLLFCLMPTKSNVSMSIFYGCFTIYVYATYLYFKMKNKRNFFDFDTLFVVLYGLCMYSATFFYPNRTLYEAMFLGYMFDTKYVNIGNLLATIGILSYYVGSLQSPSKTICLKVKTKQIISTVKLTYFLFGLVLLFLLSGGIAYSKAAYQDNAGSYSTIITYVLLLITYCSIVIIATEFYNKYYFKSYKIKKLTFILVFIVVAILLMGGSRSDASYIVIPVLALYSLFVRSVSKKEMLIFFVCAIFLMWLIGQIRTGDKIASLDNPILFLLDLTIPSRNNYAVFEYVAQKGYTYGTSFVGLFTCVPFLSNFLSLKNGSSELLTQSFFFQNPQYKEIGLGTTVIADIYIAFGLIGVVVIMYLLGKYSSKIYELALTHNYYYVVAYAALISTSIFIVRGYCTIPLRPLLWCFVISYINVRTQTNK